MKRLRTISLMAALAAALPLALAAADPKASRFYEDALDRFERRDLPGAIIQLKNALQIDRTMLPVQVLLGRALLGNGEVAAAEVALLEALKLGVNRGEIVLPLAKAYIAQGKQQLVVDSAQLSPAGLSTPVQLQLLLLRAQAYTDLGDVRSALAAVSAARALDANAVEVWLAEVPIRIVAREFREAASAVDKALKLAPKSAEAQYQRGTVLHLTGNLTGALAAYGNALALDPRHLEARIARSGLSIDLGRIDDAGKDLGELRVLSPDEPRSAYLEAVLAERAGDTAAARAALMRVTALIDPVPLDFIRFKTQLLILNGLAHFGLNEREKARPYLESYQKLHANSPTSKLLAQIYLAEPNVARAIDVLETYVRANPRDNQALMLLASAQISQGRHAKATALMQEALRGQDAPELRTVLGLSLIGGGQTADATVQLEAALKADPGQTQAAASLASLYMQRGDAARALPLAEDLVRRQPANPNYLGLLGSVRLAAGNTAGARSAFEQALKVNPDMLSAKLSLARLEIATKAYDAAAARLAQLQKEHENNVDVLFESAVLAERRGQVADAQRWLEKAVDKEGSRRLRAGLAMVDFHLRHGTAAAALESAKRLASKAPDDVLVLLAYSRAQLAAGDAAGARNNLGTVTRLAGFDSPIQVEVAALQLAARNVDGAAYSLDKALTNQPDLLPALALRAEVDLRQGEPARAEQRARRIIALSPRSALGHGLLGDVALARGQTAAAIDAFRRAHAVEPSNLTLLRLFRLEWARDGGRSSLALADQWIKSHPRDLAVRRAAADGHARNANFPAARLGYEAVLALAPDDAAVLNNLASVLLRLKDRGATKMAERAVAADPNSANAVDTLGWILFQDGQVDRALQLLRDARLRDPDNPAIRFHLATVLAHTGRKAAAVDELQAALRLGRAFDNADDAQALLKRLQ